MPTPFAGKPHWRKSYKVANLYQNKLKTSLKSVFSIAQDFSTKLFLYYVQL